MSADNIYTDITMEGKEDKMGIREFCKKHNIQTMPIKLDITKTKKRLQDGSFKMNKNLKTFDSTGKVNMNDLDDIEMCEKRWKSFEEGNNDQYNFLAWDTKRVRVIDVDCILPGNVEGKENPINTLMGLHPYKRSNSKAYGKHILVVDDITYDGIRNKQNFNSKYGVDGLGKSGIDYLNGIWAWSKLDAVIENASKPLEVDLNIFNVKEALIKPKEKKKKLKKVVMVEEGKVDLASNNVLDWRDYDLDVVKKRLLSKKPAYYSDYYKASGAILSCASSMDLRVYNILLKVLKREGSNYNGEAWVKEKWDSYDPEKHSDFTFDWYKTPDLQGFKLLITDQDNGMDFMKTYKKDIIIKVDEFDTELGVYTYDSNVSMWHRQSKGKDYRGLENFIYGKIINERIRDYIIKCNVITKKKREEVEGTEDDEEKEMKTSAYNDYVKWRDFTIKRMQNHSSIAGICSYIKKKIMSDCSLRKIIQTNLEVSTRHLFQFKNGAFNLKTGKLEPRTKEMYITMCLDYDYSPIRDEKRIQVIEAQLKQCLPDNDDIEAHKCWRGYCLTGEVSQQIYMLNVGLTAGNGKTTQSIHFEKAFPIYCKQIGNDAFDKGNDRGYDKIFASMAEAPIRLVTMEEWGAKEQDPATIKKTINGEVLKCKPLYQEEQTLRIQYKLEASANSNPNMENDEGNNRRGRKLSYDSRFVDDPLLVDESSHIYLKDKSIMDLMNDVENKLALFHLFQPYATKFYTDGKLTLPKKCETDFISAMIENDEYTDFFEDHITVLGHPVSAIWMRAFKKDIINKVEDCIKTGMNLSIRWGDISREFKKRGFKYDSQLRDGGKKKGCFVGCSIIPEENPDAQNPQLMGVGCLSSD